MRQENQTVCSINNSTCATAKKYCQYAALIIFILCILYPAFSISYHALYDSGNITERLPYAVGAIVLALGGGLLYAHYARPNTWHSYPFALWCELGLGLLSNLLMPCQEHNPQGFILASVIIASATVFIVPIAEAVSHLRKNKDMPVAHENIFHTLLGLFGIQTPYYDASLDLSSPAPRPYQDPSCDRNGETLDNLKWE